MIITKKEVKTIYSIKISLKDFIELTEIYTKNMQAHKFPRAFESIGLTEDSKVKDIENFFKKMAQLGNKDTYDYIANYYGFDGWDNEGYYNYSKGCYYMLTYNHGDTINL